MGRVMQRRITLYATIFVVCALLSIGAAPFLIRLATAQLTSIGLDMDLAEKTGHAYGVIEVAVAVMGFGAILVTLIEQGRAHRELMEAAKDVLLTVAEANTLAAQLAQFELSSRSEGATTAADIRDLGKRLSAVASRVDDLRTRGRA